MPPSHLDVLHVISSFVAAGAERFVVDLAQALQASGMSAGVAALSANRDEVGDQMCRAMKTAGVAYFSGPTERVRARSALWYTRLLFQTRPAIVHLHTPNTDLAHYIARFAYRQRHALFRTLHTTKQVRSRAYWYAIDRNPVGVSIACSSSVENAMRERIRGPIKVIANGIQFSWPVRTAEDREANCAKLGIDSSRRHFISAGRMAGANLAASPKAHDIIINAWRSCTGAQLGGQLHLLGDGNLRPELEALAKGDDSIQFHGVRSDIHLWLRACDTFIMPSRHEGLPIAGIEALATGLPCIFSGIDPLRELAAECVKWVEVDDVSGLVQAIRQSLAEPLQFCAADAMRIRDTYSIDGVARQYMNCYGHSPTTKATLGKS